MREESGFIGMSERGWGVRGRGVSGKGGGVVAWRVFYGRGLRVEVKGVAGRHATFAPLRPWKTRGSAWHLALHGTLALPL